MIIKCSITHVLPSYAIQLSLECLQWNCKHHICMFCLRALLGSGSLGLFPLQPCIYTCDIDISFPHVDSHFDEPLVHSLFRFQRDIGYMCIWRHYVFPPRAFLLAFCFWIYNHIYRTWLYGRRGSSAYGLSALQQSWICTCNGSTQMKLNVCS